jgi:hypothetical protein
MFEGLSRRDDVALRAGRCVQPRHIGVDTGDFGDATVLRKFGEVPDDLNAL